MATKFDPTVDKPAASSTVDGAPATAAVAEIRNYTMNFGPQHPAAHGREVKIVIKHVQSIGINGTEIS